MINQLYDQLIKSVLKQNKMVGEQLGIKQTNYNKLYKHTTIPFGEEDRELNIRWVKIPTFIIKNKPSYYAIFLVDIEYWRKGEIKKIYRQVIESIDSKELDSYSIFLIGKLYGFFDKMDRRSAYYHIFRINTSSFGQRERKLVLDRICEFIERRIHKLQQSGTTNVVTKNDIKRLLVFIDTFRYMRVITCAPINASNTSNRKYEVIDYYKTITSNRHITRYNARVEGKK